MQASHESAGLSLSQGISIEQIVSKSKSAHKRVSASS